MKKLSGNRHPVRPNRLQEANIQMKGMNNAIYNYSFHSPADQCQQAYNGSSARVNDYPINVPNAA